MVKTFRQIVILLGLAWVLALCGSLWMPHEDGMEISVVKALSLGDAVLWVDARNEWSYQQGHISGALNLTLSAFDEQIGEFLDHWEPELWIVIYCDSSDCGASAQLAEKLRQEYELERVHVLKGGWEQWQKHPK